jgi:hypothetical protein
VRNGSIQRFNEVVAKYGPAFKADKNHTLVQRLGHNVLKTGEGITLLHHFFAFYFYFFDLLTQLHHSLLDTFSLIFILHSVSSLINRLSDFRSFSSP